MKSWIRIALVAVVLIGSTSLFGYWSINQYNVVFDTISATYLRNTSSVYLSLRQSSVESASTSPELSGLTATSTDPQQSAESASTSPELSGLTATSTDPKLSFTSPQKNTGVYTSCIYPISWQASTTIRSFTAVLVDAGTRDTLEPKISGLAKENTIEKDKQNLDWQVGAVWPGAYYIKISKINGGDAVARSGVFIINKMPENISASEQKSVCAKSGGLL